MKRILAIVLLLVMSITLFGCALIMPSADAPYIKDGYWYVGGVNTGVRAEGVDGKDGINGKTP